MKPFREFHVQALLKSYDEQHLPLDLFISHYFRAHKALGSKDRAAVAEIVYSMIRWLGLLDYLCEAPITWEKRYEIYTNTNLSDCLKREDIPLYIRLSFPKPLFDLIRNNYSEEQTIELCRVSNTAAPTTIRANSLKTTKEALLKLWREEFDVIPCQFSEWGINFQKKTNFFSLPEFQAGLFEVQDEGSQLLADLMDVKPGQQVMDYCAGSGGKTLAFAPKMNNCGQIFVHDIRPHALMESKKRLRRAGIQNAQVALPDDPKLAKLKKKMDWVLVDAPCTGTGTMRRNPDMKWKFETETLVRLVGQQRMIFEKALSYMKPNGRIVYATCSILKEENQDQLEHFIKTYELELVKEPFQSLPSQGGMDGFFGVILKKKDITA